MTPHEHESSGLERTLLEPLLTVGEVCELFGVSKPTLYRVIRAGGLVPVRVGQRSRFRPQDVRAYLDRNRLGAGTGP